MILYEIHAADGPIAAPRFSSIEGAIAMARRYVKQGRQGVRVDQVETVWRADPIEDTNG